MSGGGEEREGERENPNQALCCQRRDQREALTHEPWDHTWAEVKSRTLNHWATDWATQAPWFLVSIGHRRHSAQGLESSSEVTANLSPEGWCWAPATVVSAGLVPGPHPHSCRSAGLPNWCRVAPSSVAPSTLTRSPLSAFPSAEPSECAAPQGRAPAGHLGH